MAAKNKVLMIVEDDAVLLRALYLAFHDSGYTIATATDGEMALKMTERIAPDIVLLDLLLPKMNGFEYLAAIRANAKLKDIPVIILSNLGDDDSSDKVKKLGITDYFIKSNTNLANLSKRVAEILK